jgi:type IV pilus assembly protein PilA
MKRFLLKICRNKKGFTLVELLIVFTLLGVLAAIMIPNVSGLVDHGHDQAAQAELSIIQTAIDSMMAKEGIDTVTVTTSTNNMSGFPTGNPLYPGYLRYEASTGNYSCNATGFVTQEATGF